MHVTLAPDPGILYARVSPNRLNEAKSEQDVRCGLRADVLPHNNKIHLIK